MYTIHVYGADGGGQSNASLYVPSGFTARYVGGPNNQVVATNQKTGQVIVFVHVAGVNSQKELRRNMRKKNSAGSRFIGRTGGKEGHTPGYRHSHITIYSSAKGRRSILYRKNSDPSFDGTYPDKSGWSDFRILIRK